MIRPFLSSSYSKFHPLKLEPVSISQEVLSIRCLGINITGKPIKKSFFFSEEEIKRGPAVGSVQAHLPWVSEDTTVNKSEKDQSCKSNTDASVSISAENEKKHYVNVLRSLEELSSDETIEQSDRKLLKEISDRINRKIFKKASFY